jgi:hypothetical protein
MDHGGFHVGIMWGREGLWDGLCEDRKDLVGMDIVGEDGPCRNDSCSDGTAKKHVGRDGPSGDA